MTNFDNYLLLSIIKYQSQRYWYNNLEPKRLRFIYPKFGEKSNLFLVDAKKNGKVGLNVLPPLICHNSDGTYTSEILEMFKR